eukprot:6224048-Amphidinium_carterae.1
MACSSAQLRDLARNLELDALEMASSHFDVRFNLPIGDCDFLGRAVLDSTSLCGRPSCSWGLKAITLRRTLERKAQLATIDR